jgi:hypothetical protein
MTLADPDGRAAAAQSHVPMRERLLVIDDFLPLDLAQSMRSDIDAHFSHPLDHAPATHQIWNYWFVTDLYCYLRTRPERVIAQTAAEAFHQALRGWSINTLGLGQVTWPNLSLYVNGCRQGLHNDARNGRFGFVYSLTRNERQTQGGRTIVHKEGDPVRSRMAHSSAGVSFYDAVEPRFNRLVVFDDRLPHAVEAVEGSMDPLEGRFVLHGHLSEGGPIVGGALPAEAIVAPLAKVLGDFAASSSFDGLLGPVTLRLDIQPDGTVATCRALLDRVLHQDPGYSGWPAVLGDLIARFERVNFPAAAGRSLVIAPVMFGSTEAPPGR